MAQVKSKKGEHGAAEANTSWPGEYTARSRGHGVISTHTSHVVVVELEYVEMFA